MIKNRLFLLMTAIALLMTVAACGSESTRVDPKDDEEDPIQSSGPYSSDLLEVTDVIMAQFKAERVSEDFRDQYKDAPIIAVIRPLNDTRFPNITKIFEERLISGLMKKTTRRELRFVNRESDTLDAVAAEKAMKESGEVTDRSGRRTKYGADFFLKAKFTALSMTDGDHSSDTINYSFELIDPETTEIVFKGDHLIKRVSEKDALYR
ncbi:MAG: hypothetical protein IT462_02755 [Planctomycetes bacterium]|nr:hypothetical protein [Planctomycetota bacterium]